MAVRYKKRLYFLLDRDVKKKGLQSFAGLTGYAMDKLSRGEDFTTGILEKICEALNCAADDIMEFVPNESRTHYL